MIPRLGPHGRTELPDIVDVMTFASVDDAGQRAWQFATIGMSNVAMVGGGRVELELTCRGDLAPGDHQQLARLLANLAAYPFVHTVAFDAQHLVSDWQGLEQVASMRSAMLLHPHFEAPAFAELAAHRVRVLWVVPIHEDERALAAGQSVAALEEALERAGADVLDLHRASSVR